MSLALDNLNQNDQLFFPSIKSKSSHHNGKTINKQEYNHILSKLNSLMTKFVILEQENQKLLGDLQHMSVENFLNMFNI
jgi:phosphotransferase system IIA component